MQADEQFKLEPQWEHFVHVFGDEMVKQIKTMTILAGRITEISVECTPEWERENERDGLNEGFAITSGVDLQCSFARRCVRPCLHPAARMLVVIEHFTSETPHTCIDFDDREATAAQINNTDYKGYSIAWTEMWPDLLAKWYGDPVLCSSAPEDAIWNLMLLDDVSDETPTQELDLEALAGLLNVVRTRLLDAMSACMAHMDDEITKGDFESAYAPFAGKQMAFSHRWEDFPVGALEVAIDLDGSSAEDQERFFTETLDVQHREQFQTASLPLVGQSFAQSPFVGILWNWEEECRRFNSRLLLHALP